MHAFARYFASIASILVCLAGLLLTTGFFNWVKRWESTVAQSNFSRQAQAASLAIENNLHGALEHLRLLGEMFDTRNGNVSRADFRLFTRPLLKRAPFVQGFAFNRIVLENERAGFEKMRAKEFPKFRIFEMHDGKTSVAASRPYYRVIDYIEPFHAYQSSVGQDAHAIANAAEVAALAAQQTGQAQVTQLLTLSSIKQYGFLIFLPLYRTQMDSTIADRKMYGLVVAIFAIDKSVSASLASLLTPAQLDLKIHGKDERGWVEAYATTPTSVTRHAPLPILGRFYDESDFHYAKDFELLNAPWRLRASMPRTHPFEEHITSILTLLIGWMLTLALSIYTFAALSGARRIRELVTERTAALNSANARLKSDVATREAHNRILHRIATGAALPEILDELLMFPERALPQSSCLIILADGSVQGPRLPPEFLADLAACSAKLSVTLRAEQRWHSASTASFAGRRQSDLQPKTWRGLRFPAGVRSMASWPIYGKGGNWLGAIMILSQQMLPVADEARELIRTSINLAGILIESRRAEEYARHLMHHDELTGLPNRLLFGEHLHMALGRVQRSGKTLAVLFLDLDRFKHVNDSFGHNAGDELLRSITMCFRSCLRDPDSLARVGGDEFILMLEDYSDLRHVGEIAERLVEEACKPFQIAGQQCHVGVSVGIATYPADGEDVSTLLKHADIAMYRAKAIGRGNYQFYSPEMNTHALNRLVLESGLRRALDQHEIVVHYQPKICVASGRIVGLEALVRWQSQEQGLILPNDFIPFAEEIGLISTIGMRVLRDACVDIARFREAGIDCGRVAVNLSGVQFNDRHLVGDVRDVIAAAGISAEDLEFEVTESMVMQDRARAIGLMEGIRTLGITLSIDDFGTGYSSLASLKRFPVDSLKIDRSFIEDVGADADSAGIVHAIIVMAHTLGLRVIAEGVESLAQLDVLRRFGCDEYQGYYFSQALSADDLLALMSKQRALML